MTYLIYRYRKRPRPDRDDPTNIPALDGTTLRIWSPVLSVLSNIAQTSRREDEDKDSSDEPADVLSEALARKCLQFSLKPALHALGKVERTEPAAAANMDEDFMIIDDGGEEYTGVTDEKELAALEEQTYRFAVHVWLVALWTNGMEDQAKAEDVDLDLGLTGHVREELGIELVEGIMDQLLGRMEGEPGR